MSPAQQGSVRGGEIVDTDRLTRQVKPIADRFCSRRRSSRPGPGAWNEYEPSAKGSMVQLDVATSTGVMSSGDDRRGSSKDWLPARTVTEVSRRTIAVTAVLKTTCSPWASCVGSAS